MARPAHRARPHTAVPHRPHQKTIKLGTAQVIVPPLQGAVGPEQVRPQYPRLNDPADLALVDDYLKAIADLRSATASNLPPGTVTGTQLLAVAQAVANWRTDRNGAIAAFQRIENVGTTVERRDNVLTPNGPSWEAIVTYGELAKQLEVERNKPNGGADYIHYGGFRRQDFVNETTTRFRADPVAASRFTQISIPNMLDLLDRMSRDPLIIDIRWMAYMLATAMWETSVTVTVPAAATNGKHKGKPSRVSQWGSPVEEGGKGWLNKNNVKDYYLPVKVNKLPDGSAEVTEQDGDVFDVNTSGKITKKTPGTPGIAPKHGADFAKYAANPSQVYAQAAGTEHAYYGRGYVQLTWWDNYAKSGAEIGMGIELLFDPDKALQADTAYKLMSDGMVNGHGFANKHRLQHYFYGGHTDYVGARRMVNGTNEAQKIAGIARIFEASLMASRI